MQNLQNQFNEYINEIIDNCQAIKSNDILSKINKIFEKIEKLKNNITKMSVKIKNILEKDESEINESTNYIITKCDELIEVVDKTYQQMYNNFQNRLIKLKESHRKYQQINTDLITAARENIKRELEALNYGQIETYNKAQKKFRKTIEIDQNELLEKILNHLKSEFSTIETKEVVISNTNSIDKIRKIVEECSLNTDFNTTESICKDINQFNNNLNFDSINNIVDNNERSIFFIILFNYHS